uniref:Lysine acetyltransferase 14 n=1 Tax=Astyanax mexicanus TaxID=7994 RepID=A0A8B9JQM4_ASTMX
MDSGDQRSLTGQDEDALCTSASEGLEEGEVEGETLLIVESEDQASVDLSHDQSGDSLNSDVGEDGDGSWNEDMSFYCDKCHKWIASAQLRGEQPSYLKGDNFFKFICSDCSDDGKESFERMRLTWQQVVMLAMYNLSLEGTGRQGYFRWKEDICAFISQLLISGLNVFVYLCAPDDEELDTEGVIDPGIECIPPATLPLAAGTLFVRKKQQRPVELIKQEPESEDEERARDAEGEEGQDEGLRTRVPAGSERRKEKALEKVEVGPRYALLGLYEERMLLRRLESCPQALAVTPQAKRLRCKLLVRQAKRERGLPLLDADQAVSAALSLVGGVYSAQAGVVTREISKYRTTSQDLRILDRFQVAASNRKGFYQSSVSFWHRLMGSDVSIDQGIKSPYTSRILKPYIRRDYETKPLKMNLLAEIRAYPHRSDSSWVPEPDAPIDYCYVRPNHIPSVNSMCHDMFWPGVDLSECLQYPDFSVVVLYKKVIIGFGFMVPDVKYNEAYISFLLVHPEWRRAGIASFMIYHLIQTCMGKDVTLHVSASNPAMLLYQKFGFKTEEYILDFYDKYYPVDSKECRHAFFLRLRR